MKIVAIIVATTVAVICFASRFANKPGDTRPANQPVAFDIDPRWETHKGPSLCEDAGREVVCDDLRVKPAPTR